jgi:hypothetical protein
MDPQACFFVDLFYEWTLGFVHQPRTVYLRVPLVVEERPRAPYEVFVVASQQVYDAILDSGEARPFKRGMPHPRRHSTTGRYFTDTESLAAFAARHEARDVSWWIPETPQESVPSPLVRPQSDDRMTWTRDETLAVLVEAARKIPSYRRLTWTEIAKRMRPHYSRNILTDIHKTHQITLEEVASYR